MISNAIALKNTSQKETQPVWRYRAIMPFERILSSRKTRCLDKWNNKCVRRNPFQGKFHVIIALLWRHNERDSVSNYQRLYCLLKRLFRRRSKVTSKLRVTGLCAWNSPGTGEFPAQKASNAENVSIWWRHHGVRKSIFHVGSSDITLHSHRSQPAGKLTLLLLGRCISKVNKSHLTVIQMSTEPVYMCLIYCSGFTQEKYQTYEMDSFIRHRVCDVNNRASIHQ